LYFVLLLGSIAYIFSKIVAAQLRKRNRFSLVEGILLGMTIIGIINIPFSLYRRYADNGHNLNILFGFGHLC
jgi:putative effector of murein hydrolase